jgi:hypothetical protein
MRIICRNKESERYFIQIKAYFALGKVLLPKFALIKAARRKHTLVCDDDANAE